MKFNGKIKRISRTFFADYVGFADLGRYQDDLASSGGNIVEGYKYGISLGLAIPDSIADHLPERGDVNAACAYRVHGYDVLNRRLNLMASSVASFLNGKGYRTLPVTVAERTDMDRAASTVSHKMIARIAGLGWIGKSCLLITPERGPRVRFTSVLTDAPLKAVDEPMEQRCGSCVACAKACPVGAISGRNYAAGEPREARLAFTKCQDYLREREETLPFGVCGMCLYACPYGMKKR